MNKSVVLTEASKTAMHVPCTLSEVAKLFVLIIILLESAGQRMNCAIRICGISCVSVFFLIGFLHRAPAFPQEWLLDAP